ncbi:MAG TPA: RNA methyltransferase [Bradyrhizobium sp.]|nr:RNA methyltransferase [Bradyrhizobium sp.]
MPTFLPINDPADPRISDYLDVRECDLVGRQGRFIAEGEVVLRALLSQSRYGVESLFLSDRRITSLEHLLAKTPATTPVYVAPQAVMDQVAGFPIHRGVLALGRRPLAPSPAELLSTLPPNALVLALIGITNHDNVGGLFRNAAAFGVSAILLDRASCDPLYRKAVRVSVGASLLVPFVRVDTPLDLLAILSRAEFDVLALSPSGNEPLASVRRQARTALIMGSEGAGLPEVVLSRTRSVHIPMANGFDSLNVATASGIALHHLSRQGLNDVIG